VNGVGAQTLRGLAWRILVRFSLFAAPLGAAISVYYVLWAPLPAGASRVRDVFGNLSLMLIYSIVLMIVLHQTLRRTFATRLGWLTEDREPDDGERRLLVEIPPRIALLILRFFIGVAIVTTVLNYAGNRIAAQSARVLVGLTLTAFTFTALIYLVVEHELRGLFSRALTGSHSRHKVGPFSVQTRFLMAWTIGSGIPLVFIVAIPLSRAEAGRVRPSLIVPAVFMAAVGIAFGSLMTVLAARSVSQPLAGVRAGLQRVGEGNLDVDVPVDDAGEVGRLQSGFNAMVSGLRQRRVIEDLFGRHVGVDVARRALDQGVRLGGERLEVSALFVDLIGSTPLAQKRPPEEVVRLLNEFFRLVVETVTANGGWVNKFEGDAAVCVFGAPSPQPDHAVMALRAAREMRQGLDRMARRHPEIDAGIGVSTGTVVAGNIGSEDRFEYTVIGDPVNEAARLTEMAKQTPGRVLASGHSVELAGGESSEWCPGETVTLRGRAQQTPTYTPRRR